MANIMEKLAGKLGMKPPPEPRPVPNLLAEGQFGPAEAQPEATTGVATFDVLGLGLVDDQLLAAKARIIANTRKIIGEAKRAYLYANGMQRVMLTVEGAAFGALPAQLPAEPILYPRQKILEDLAALEQRERMHSATYAMTTGAAQQAAAAQSRAIIAAGGEAAYAAQQAAQQQYAQAAAARDAEWRTLAAAGDPAGKAWIELQGAIARYNAANSNYQSSARYATTPEAKANVEQLRVKAEAARAERDQWQAIFNQLNQQREWFIAKQQLAAGTHPYQLTIAKLEAKRLDKTQEFTVSDNVNLATARKQLDALVAQVANVTGSV